MMDAVEYIKSFNRLCNAMDKDCDRCPLGENCVSDYQDVSNPIANVKYVEAWAKGNPPNTRQSKILKDFPNARLIKGLFLMICPKHMDKSYSVDCNAVSCSACEEKYWLEEIE